jgi:signal transduction histidine kinase
MDSGLTSIIAFCTALGTTQDRQELGALIIRHFAAAGAVDMAALYLLDEESRQYVRLAAHGPVPPEPRIIPTGPELDRLSDAAISGLVPASSLNRSGFMLPQGTEWLLPFASRGRLLGFCLLGPTTAPAEHAEHRRERLSLAGLCTSLALDNFSLWNESRTTRQLMRRSDRMRSVETMAAGFAHEIRNPLTSIKTFITLAPDRRNDPEFMSRFSQVAAEDVGRIERLIKEILDYARSAEPAFKPEDLNEVVAASIHFLELTATDRAIELSKDFGEGLPPVTMDRHQIQQVVMNLVINAVEAMTGGPGALSLSTRRVRKHGTDEWVQIAVSDTGCGIPADTLEHIFDPFYTTKHESTEREGTGLGLAIAHQMVRDHRGYIEVTSRPGAGTTFCVNLPIHPPSHPPAPGTERRRASRNS